MIDPVTVQKIKDTADIVDVVSDYVHLVRRGGNYMGLCPFHNERTPSFSVNKARNFCYCFSCHKGGSPVNFIMEKEGVSYHDALLQLAKKYGIEVKEKELSDEERLQQTRREAMLVANDWAKNYFISNLEKEEGTNIGLTYLYNRGVTPEAIKAFNLGYAIDNGTDFTEAAVKQGFSTEILKAVGLTGTNQRGGDYDRFRGRVIFPVINTSGKTVAFGGRDLKGGPAKYINSPESEVYSKSKELYGIYTAKGDMVKENKCFLVEGYLDVIGMWQSGIRNVVASSGTALTDGQISLIHRFTDNVTLIYDGDAAGIKASLRGIDMLLSHNLNVKAVLLPDGEDPDSLSAKLTPQQLKDFLSDNETDIIRFKINVLLDEAKSDPQKRWTAIRSIVDSIAHIPDKIKREIYVHECSLALDFNESTLSREVGKTRFKIIEQDKQRKRLEDLDKDNLTNYRTDNSEVTTGVRPNIENNLSPLFPLEKELIYNCLKYGFITLYKNEEEEQKNSSVTVIEYIKEELEIDGISFTHPEYLKVFEELNQLVTLFKQDLADYESIIEEKANKKREEGKNKIATGNISLAEILRAEKNLENDLLLFMEEERYNFSKNYIFNIFGSHEDEIIRKHTNSAYSEKHRLSNIFNKNKETEKPVEKILPLIVTSLNVLKNGIIDLELKKIMDQMKNIEAGDTVKEKEFHNKISQILEMRKRMAKDIGERIIDPNKNGKKDVKNR